MARPLLDILTQAARPLASRGKEARPWTTPSQFISSSLSFVHMAPFWSRPPFGISPLPPYLALGLVLTPSCLPGPLLPPGIMLRLPGHFTPPGHSKAPTLPPGRLLMETRIAPCPSSSIPVLVANAAPPSAAPETSPHLLWQPLGIPVPPLSSPPQHGSLWRLWGRTGCPHLAHEKTVLARPRARTRQDLTCSNPNYKEASCQAECQPQLPVPLSSLPITENSAYLAWLLSHTSWAPRASALPPTLGARTH